MPIDYQRDDRRRLITVTVTDVCVRRVGLQLTKQGGPDRGIEILLNVVQIDAWIVRHAPRR